jgi:hypothetical protein
MLRIGGQVVVELDRLDLDGAAETDNAPIRNRGEPLLHRNRCARHPGAHTPPAPALAQVGLTVAVVVLQLGLRNVLELFSHE